MSKLVIANYRHTDAFKIPKGLDLEDKKQVKCWGIKWGTLCILKTNGTELRINSLGWDNDYKYPQDTFIEDRADYGIDDSDDDNDEEKD